MLEAIKQKLAMSFVAIGPRQITGVSRLVKRPIEM